MMDTIDLSQCVLENGALRKHRHVHSSWNVAYWRAAKVLCPIISLMRYRTTDLPLWLLDSIRSHFVRNDEFRVFCSEHMALLGEPLSFREASEECISTCVMNCSRNGNVRMLECVLEYVSLPPLLVRRASYAACAHGWEAVISLLWRGGSPFREIRIGAAMGLVAACESGHVVMVQYLHRILRLQLVHFRQHNNRPLRAACKEGQVKVVRYLHLAVGLTADDFKSDGNFISRMVCGTGNLTLLKYLHHKVGFGVGDFSAADACRNGKLEVVEYLHRQVGVVDFRGKPAQDACSHSQRTVVEYLHRQAGMTAADFGTLEMRDSILWGGDQITGYLQQHAGFPRVVVPDYGDYDFDCWSENPEPEPDQYELN